MLREESLKDLLSQKKLGHADKLLICLAVGPVLAKEVRAIKKLAKDNGLRAAANWNVSHLLKSSGKAVRTVKGWELTSDGLQHVSSLAGPLLASPVLSVAPALCAYLTKIAEPQTAAFVEEAIACFEAHQYRAAVVLSWVGAVSVLQSHVIRTPGMLAAFNADAVSRFSAARHPFTPAKTADDLGRLKEADFLVVLESVRVLTKNVKQRLEVALSLRNSCGHPNNYVIGEHATASHIEDLINNVYSKF